MSRRAIAAAVGVLLLIAAATLLYLATKPFHRPASSKTAFLNAKWGMSKTQVETANAVTLGPPASKRQLFTPSDRVDASRYQSYEQTVPALFLGRQATVCYVFFDDRLFTYDVFVKDAEGEALDSEMRHYLTDRFGSDLSEVNDQDPLRLVWQEKYRIVNYWFYQEAFSLSQKYTAGFGVVYRPINDAIGRGPKDSGSKKF